MLNRHCPRFYYVYMADRHFTIKTETQLALNSLIKLAIDAGMVNVQLTIAAGIVCMGVAIVEGI